MAFLTLYKGDSSDIIPVRPQIQDAAEVISDDWVCSTSIVDANGVPIVAPRVESVKDDANLNWLVSLSVADTNAVEVLGKFTRVYWVVQIENPTLAPAYSREKHFEVIVRASGIPTVVI